MKLTHIIKGCGVLLSLTFLSISCTKKSGKEVAQESTDPSTKALVQVFDASINSAGTFIYVDNNPVNGAALTYGTVFPASSYAFIVDPGVRSFSIRNTSAGTTQTPINFSLNADPAKNYTVFLYDTSTAGKQITIENKIVVPTDGTARVKFANFAWLKNATASSVDVYSKLNNANVFEGIASTQVTEYIPYIPGINDSLIVRQAGTTIGLDTVVLNFLTKRSYTLIYRGRHITNEAGGAAFPRTLSAFPNN